MRIVEFWMSKALGSSVINLMVMLCKFLIYKQGYIAS
jgi:hypothetical protein